MKTHISTARPTNAPMQAATTVDVEIEELPIACEDDGEDEGTGVVGVDEESAALVVRVKSGAMGGIEARGADAGAPVLKMRSLTEGCALARVIAPPKPSSCLLARTCRLVCFGEVCMGGN